MFSSGVVTLLNIVVTADYACNSTIGLHIHVHAHANATAVIDGVISYAAEVTVQYFCNQKLDTATHPNPNTFRIEKKISNYGWPVKRLKILVENLPLVLVARHLLKDHNLY